MKSFIQALERNDSNSNRQIEDQTWENTGNAALLRSMDEGLPVRVIRGHNHNSSFHHLVVILMQVYIVWSTHGWSKVLAGMVICRYKLVYSGDNLERDSIEQIEPHLDHSARKKTGKRNGITCRSRFSACTNG